MADGKDTRLMDGDDENQLDPFEINFLPEFRKERGPEGPFVNEHGVTIGDHEYDSPQSPLKSWSKETDPSVMAGDEWVHPFKDVGFHTRENREHFEQGIQPKGGIFMHPDKDVAYPAYNSPAEGAAAEGKQELGQSE